MVGLEVPVVDHLPTAAHVHNEVRARVAGFGHPVHRGHDTAEPCHLAGVLGQSGDQPNIGISLATSQHSPSRHA